jgi:hypothetical protein
VKHPSYGREREEKKPGFSRNGFKTPKGGYKRRVSRKRWKRRGESNKKQYKIKELEIFFRNQSSFPCWPLLLVKTTLSR